MKTTFRDCGIDGLTFTQPSLTRSEFAVECDLKTIIRRFMTTGQLPGMMNTFDGDVTTLPEDYTELQNLKVGVEQRFAQLPVEVQEQFESPEDWYLSTLQDTPEAKSPDTPEAKSPDTPEATSQAT